MRNTIPIQNVRVTGGVFRERMNINRNYLAELDVQCLLQNFYLEAGIIMPGLQVVEDPANANLHWGWEAPTCQLRGHFLGHWMSAAAKLIASEGDRELQYNLEKIVAELAECQRRNGGEWVGSIPEKYFDLMTEGLYVWSPQYTIHKTLMGLVDTYIYTKNAQALNIADHFADWFVRWSERAPDAVYRGEQGGMLEIWATLFAITGDAKYQTLIARYKGNGIYNRLQSGGDALSDDHANASIPHIHGAAKMYEITGEQHWANLVAAFWKNAVTVRRMYATTGANAGEFWIPNGQLGAYLGDRDQEFCTVYNMVRTADFLYRLTGDTAYADYIERALYNGFLAQQNRENGMPTYFLPLRAGCRKKWGSKRHDFWCCHGTMVQAQATYPELIYYCDDSRISVMQYIPSEAEITLGGSTVHIAQMTEMKNYNGQVFFDEIGGGEKSRWSLKFSIDCDKPAAFTLALRVPKWAKGSPLQRIGETVTEPQIENGCIILTREWAHETIYVMFRSEITFEALPDQPELAAAVDGPIVLAGLTDRDCGLCGDAPADIFVPRTEHTYETYVWKQNCYVTKNQPTNLEFVPLYDVTDEAYTVYFTIKTKTAS